MRILDNGFHRLIPAILLALALAGCGGVQKNDASPSGNEHAGAATIQPTATQEAAVAGGEASTEPVATPQPDMHAEVMVYGGNPDFTATVSRKADIAYASNEDLIKKTLAELQNSNHDQLVSLWKDIIIHSVKLDADKVEMDISINDEKRLGAPGEQMLIDTLKSTLFQFDFVNEIEVTQDGDKVESLMGHVDLEDPITRKSN